MLKWLRSFRGGSRDSRTTDTVLNDGLALAMDWGENWLAPIQNRLAQQHPQLTRSELDELNATCQAAMRFAQETIHTMVRQSGEDVSPDQFAAVFLAQYPWVNSENRDRMFNQGMYYAWKTGRPVSG